MTENKPKAAIYLRVSDPKQVERGDGLQSQERTCRDFAERKGYEVVRVFQDVLTGERADRPGIREVKAYLRRHRGTILIVDHANRLGRDLLGYLLLRADIENLGGILQSPVMEFRQDSSSQLVENVVASVSQYQRQHNAEQTKNRMHARALNGFWGFQAPVGYRYEKTGRGKLLVRDEPVASIVREALEGYASGRFETQAEVMHFLQQHPLFPKDARGIVRHQRVTVLLNQCLYAGYLEVPRWNIALRPAQHEPLISFETYQAIQQRLSGGVYAPRQRNLNDDFPLRGFVVCADCGTPLTACWSKGSHSRHPYYLCPKRGCASYGKSIRRAHIEGEFEDVLKALTPSETLFQLTVKLFKGLWKHRGAQVQDQSKALAAELAKVDQQVAQLLERILDASLPSVIAAYENRIRALEEKKLLINEKMANAGHPNKNFDKALRTALVFLSSPWNIWDSGQLEERRTVLKLAFSDRLQYKRNEGFRTADLALPFKMLAEISGSQEMMARPKRFELLTPRFVVCF